MSNERATEGVKPMPEERAHGRFTIQVCDAETGKVKRTYESDNYVTDMHYTQARHLQTQLVQGGYFPQTDATNSIDSAIDVNQGYAGEGVATPGIAPNFLVCTDWDEAEDTTETWGKGNITAFAPFAKVTALSTGRKGLINETESSIAANGSTVTYVWDWSTTQGNGTFQSIMLANVGVYSDVNAALYCGAGEHGRSWPYYDGTYFTNLVNFCSDGTTVLAVGGSDDDGLNYFRWIDCTTDFNGGGDSVADGSGRWFQMGGTTVNDWATAWTEVGTNWGTNTTSSSNSTYFAGPGWDCCHDGTNIFFISHSNNTSTLGIRAYNIGTGTALYDNTATGWTPASRGGSWSDHCTGITKVGTKLYAIYINSTDATGTYVDRRRIARLDATTGAFEAYVDLDSVLGATEYLSGNIENDGTDLIVETTQGIKKFTVGGAYVANSNIGMARLLYDWTTGAPDGMQTSNINHWQESGVAPDSTGIRWQLGPYRTGENGVHSSRQGRFVMSDMKYNSDTIQYRFTATPYRTWLTAPNNRVSSSMSSSWDSKQLKLFRHGGKLWLADRVIGTNDVQGAWAANSNAHFAIYSVDGLNMFSRARLDTPVSKSSSETMKITYQITLPADPLNEIAHVNPWA